MQLGAPCILSMQWGSFRVLNSLFKVPASQSICFTHTPHPGQVLYSDKQLWSTEQTSKWSNVDCVTIYSDLNFLVTRSESHQWLYLLFGLKFRAGGGDLCMSLVPLIPPCMPRISSKPSHLNEPPGETFTSCYFS